MKQPPRYIQLLPVLVTCVVVLLSMYGLFPTPALAATSSEASSVSEAVLPIFDILEYDVEGNTRLSDNQIERSVTPFLGEARTLRDVEAARLALETAYHDAGYLTVVVSIPEQRVDDGNVILSVVEGKVEHLRVKGAEYHLASGIKQQVPELAEGNVPYFPQVQREIEGLNRTADMKATPVLKAGRTPGSVEVGLDVDDSLPLHGNVELNNHNSPYTDPLRLLASLRYDNLWQSGHSFNLSAQTSPQATQQSRVLSGTYVMPIGGKGDALSAYAMHSSSNVPSFPTGVLGNSDILGVRYAAALPMTSEYSQSLSMGVDHKNVKQSLVVGNPGGPVTTTPPITYSPLVALYNGAWLEKSGSTAINAQFTEGMRGLFGNRDSDFTAKRSGASADFYSLRGSVQQTETIERWTLSGKLEMQIASGPLVPNEQYTAGGADSVRGYQESEIVGDEALRLGLEIRTPHMSLGSLRLAGVGFYEGARLRTLQPVFPQPDYALIRGAGLGLRLSGPGNLSLDLDLARALNAGQTTRAGDSRLHSRVVLDF